MGPLLLTCKLLIDFCLLPLSNRRARADAAGIVRLDAIGDFVVWLPAAQALIANLRAQGSEHVVLIANAVWADWAASLLPVDQIVAVDTGRFSGSLRYRLSVLRQVRLLQLGTLIAPTYSRIPGDGNDALAFASGASVRIANKGYVSKHRLAGWLRSLLNTGYSKVLATAPPPPPQGGARPISEAEINASFTKALGAPQHALVGTIAAADIQIEPVLPESGSYILFIPGGSWSGKAWPIERFAEIARRLRDQGFKILITGSASEHPLCEELARSCNGRNLAGKTTLQGLAEVIRHARLVIGNDSAGMHIAVATRSDSICVMWGGSFGRFIPYPQDILPSGLQARAVYQRMDCFGCTGACPFPTVQGKVKCIDAVSIAAVWNAVDETLRAGSPRVVHPLSTDAHSKLAG
jgi:ADP-heptose:LPS heptosyltransferase